MHLTVLVHAFDQGGLQTTPLPAHITGDLAALDTLLERSGWRREKIPGADPLLHHLLAGAFTGA